MAQTFYPITPVEISVTSYGGWYDKNLSSYIPSGGTGAIFHVVNKNTSAREFGIRKNGSTDNTIARKDILQGSHFWGAIGIDGSRYVEIWQEDSDIDVWLVGYTTSGVTFNTNGVDLNPTTTSAWTDKDLSSLAPNAIGVILHSISNISYQVGFRKNGSSDNRNTAVYYGRLYAMIGCDANQVIEYWINNTDVDVYLLGYITDGAVFNTNALDRSLSTTGAWTDLTALPSSAIMGFYEVYIYGVNYSYGLREDGSAEDLYYDMYYCHCLSVVDCSDSNIVEGKIENVSIDFFELGYAKSAIVYQGVAGTLTSAGTIAKLPKKKVGQGYVSFSGVVQAIRYLYQSIAGTLTSAGTLAKKTSTFPSGSLASSGALSWLPKKILSGTITPAGSLLRNITKAFAGSLLSAGSVIASRIVLVDIYGMLDFAGSLKAGVVATVQAVGGALTLSGSLAKNIGKKVIGVIEPQGALAKMPSIILKGSLWYIAGSLHKYNIYKIASGVLSSAGSLVTVRFFAQVIGGTLNLSGSVARSIGKVFSGVLSSTGGLKRYIKLLPKGSLITAGQVYRYNIYKAFSGTLNSSGALQSISLLIRQVGGTLNLSGSVLKSMFKGMAGSITPIGSLAKNISLALSGGLSLVGNILKFIPKHLSGALSFIGILERPGRAIKVSLLTRPYRDMSVDIKPFRDMFVDTREVE